MHAKTLSGIAGRWSDLLLSLTAYHAVRWYQIHISPHKGFRCACAALTNGPSCSAFALTQLETSPFLAAVTQIRGRLEVCRAVYMAYKTGLLDAAIQRSSMLPVVTMIGSISCCPGCDEPADRSKSEPVERTGDTDDVPKGK
jgi:putative component of membrane protein insertase Oxa1/YidC/SpoIIIJ protein YidD